MCKLCGEWLPFIELENLSLEARLTDAHDSLVKRTGIDFGYDLKAWHEYLSCDDRYTWSNKHLTIAAQIAEALVDPAWIAAVQQIENASR